MALVVGVGVTAGCERARPEAGPRTERLQAGLAWTRVGAFASPESAVSDQFGTAVAAAGTTAIVGASGAGAGAVFVYDRAGPTFTFSQKLVAADGAQSDAFGGATALAGDVAAVGAYIANAAYVFRRSASGWDAGTKIVPAGIEAFDGAGACVALDEAGSTLAVGVRDRGAGMVFVYRAAANGAFVEDGTLTPSDGGDYDQFGASCAIAGGMIFVGAPWHGQGAVYGFRKNGGAYVEAFAPLAPTNSGPSSRFGTSVAAAGNHLAVGAYDHAAGNVGLAGAVYLYAKAGDAFAPVTTLFAPTPATNDRFGWSVALTPSRLVVGAQIRRTKSGKAFVYALTSAAPTLATTLEGQTPSAGDSYGYAVAAAGDTVVVGGPRDPYVSLEGRVTMDRLAKAPGEACAAAAECGSLFCADGVCCDTACGDGADDCQACSVATGAREDGTCAPLARGVACRPARSSCDVVDVCDGTSAACPADAVKTNGAVCEGGGQCLGGQCTSSSSAPEDARDGEGAEDGATPPSSGCALGAGTRGGTTSGASAGGELVALGALMSLVRRLGSSRRRAS